MCPLISELWFADQSTLPWGADISSILLTRRAAEALVLGLAGWSEVGGATELALRFPANIVYHHLPAAIRSRLLGSTIPARVGDAP
jgi:hypothetical protein